MADPLSLTLAALTFASALKDMVELAQAIEESFEKVSRNRRELRSLVSEIKTTVFQLKKFSDDHYDVLCDAVDTKHAILGLISDMRTIYDKCRDMGSPVPPNKIRRFKRDVKAWLKNNTIEEDIKNLRNRVDKCHSQFMIFAVMRIESRLIVMSRQSEERPKEIQEEITTLRPSNDSLIAFVGSNARTLSKLPPGITPDFISNSYLGLQILTIDDMLNELSSTSYPVGDPHLYFLPVEPQNHAQDKNVIRQKLILHTLEIQSFLRGDSQNMSMHTCVMSMSNICLDLLVTLDMSQEAQTIFKWILNISRTLSQTRSKIYLLLVALCLCLVSKFRLDDDDFDGSVSALEEAIQIIGDSQWPALNIIVDFQIARAVSWLAYRLDVKERNEESLQAAQEGVTLYENAINKKFERISHGRPIKLFKTSLASLLKDFPHGAIRGYGLALTQLSFSFMSNGRQDDSYNTAREALDILTFCSNILKDNTLEAEIAIMSCWVSDRRFHGFISLEDALSFSERGVATFRCFYSKDVEGYRNTLRNALCEQADILGSLERWNDASICWREIAELARDVMDDQFVRADALCQLCNCLRKLNRHDEAVSIRKECVTIYTRHKAETDPMAVSYYNLGVELRLAEKQPEAIKALRSALMQYRALAVKDPEYYTKTVGETLNELTMNLIHCKEFDQAFKEGHESLKLHESLIEKDSSVLDNYIFAIQLNSLVAEVADNEEKCVERARYNVSCACALAALHPIEANLLFCHSVHSLATVLSRFDRVSEAGIELQKALEWHEKNPSQEEEYVEQHMTCLNTMTVILYNQGYIAMEYLQKSIDVGKPYSNLKSVSLALVRSMYHRIQCLCVIGLYAEAVEASQECVDFARETEMEGIQVAEFVTCLQAGATAFNCLGRFREAIDYIQEALRLSCSGDILELSKNGHPQLLRLEVESLTYLCDILADAGQEAEALVKGKSAVDKALGLKSQLAALPWSYIEPTYFFALETCSICLAINGDLSESLDRLVQVRSYYEKRIDSRLGESSHLACDFEAEGIISCAAGRLDDGAAAVAKLHDLQNRLRINHPELAKNVEVALERQRTSPSIIALVRKLNLKCNHEHQKSSS